jgi:mono/diheme cytochrome c family protein
MRPSIAGTTLICAAALLWIGAASADPKATYEKVCGNCHEHADFAGQPADKLTEKIKNIVNGTTKHKKKLTLTDDEAAAMAAYLSAGK